MLPNPVVTDTILGGSFARISLRSPRVFYRLPTNTTHPINSPKGVE
jgi:hypothetical protein